MRHEDPGRSPAYWMHNIKPFPDPVTQFRMAQLVDFDGRLNEPARVVYRFIIGWYMDRYGDALASVRTIEETMRGRLPIGKSPSRSAIDRSLKLLIKHGWLVCTACHGELTHGGYLVRFARTPEFRAFQARVIEQRRQARERSGASLR